MKKISAIILALAAVVVPASRAMSAGDGRPAPVVKHVVRSGETLWGIARATRPGEDPRRVVAEIVERNELGSRPIRAGQVLVLPG